MPEVNIIKIQQKLDKKNIPYLRNYSNYATLFASANALCPVG